MKRNIFASVIVLLSFILVYSSCNRIDTTDLGNELIPVVDNVNTFDTTLDVITDQFLDTSSTTMLYNEAHGVGIIENDAEFGRTESILYTSFVPSNSHFYPFVNRDSVQIDSVVLSLSFTGLYGDSNSVQNFEIKEIDPIFKFADTGYKINHPDLPVRPTAIGTRSVFFNTLNDQVIYKNKKDTVRNTSELRIKLDTSWARRFVNYDTTANDAYNNDSIFKTKFRGLEVRALESSPVKRGLAYFNLNDNAKTRITFYCRVQNNGKADTITPYFMYSARSPQANLVRRIPNNGYLANINNGLPNDEKVYLQTTPGSFVTIQIPGLDQLDNRVIHRAELITERVPSGQEALYQPPPSLFIEAISTTGDSVFTIRNDFVPANAAVGYDVNLLGGVLKNSKYVFNLSRYVQSIVTKKQTSYTLRVRSPFTIQPFYITSNDVPTVRVPIVINPFLAGGRVVLYGGGFNDPAKKMRLRIIYSRI